ncbi:Spo0E family sporulation regulatory protein-aspartic acid phosphatase [Desulfitobacterium sp. AusDCA]|uniref:Spo0E family sporulation regulatory protein-aspartic acid phosphatase n=1 Tax=Desulfitobacterium sp. AusDCA TaxID=3240383 RepID=UPI003DA6F49F
MAHQIARIRISIEETRRKLLSLGKSKALTDPEVIKLSQHLDKLLNRYEALRRDYIYTLRHKGALHYENYSCSDRNGCKV